MLQESVCWVSMQRTSFVNQAAVQSSLLPAADFSEGTWTQMKSG